MIVVGLILLRFVCSFYNLFGGQRFQQVSCCRPGTLTGLNIRLSDVASSSHDVESRDNEGGMGLKAPIILARTLFIWQDTNLDESLSNNCNHVDRPNCCVRRASICFPVP